jgi:uroporphyrinogen-III synthase
VTVYRTLAAEVDADTLREQLCGRRLDAITFTSPSTAEYFVALLNEESLKAAADCTVAAIGPVTADALRRLGLVPNWVPNEPTVRALVEGLVGRMGREPEGDER